MEDSTTKIVEVEEERETGTEFLYKLEDKPPFYETVVLSIQHVLAMFVGIITPPLIIAGVADLNPLETGYFVSMALIISGVTTFFQVKQLGPFGSGLLAVQGTSFTFVPMAIVAANVGGLPLVLGMALITSPVEMILSRFLTQTRKIFPPVVSGTVVMLIGLGLIRVAITDIGGGAGATNFGSAQNLSMALFVLLVIVIANVYGKGIIKVGAIAIGLVVGYLVAIPLGMVNFAPIVEAGWVTVPIPLKYGLSFNWALIIPWILAYIITTIETVGDLTAIAEVSCEPIEGEVHDKRLKRGVLLDGVGSALAAIFNTLPNTTFSQNTGVIQFSKIASRVVGYGVALVLILLGIFPKIGALVSVMPKPVLGGATIALFGMVAMAGMRIAVKDGLNDKKMFILAFSLALGLGVTFRPDIVNQLPEWMSVIFSSNITVGFLTAFILNLIIPEPKKMNQNKA
ncbi:MULTISPECIES: uracil-xanthine permease family protein [Petrotoga]|uniref:NCS2 family nucleobase:cation symporter-2/xanthine permease XanP n=2 Tax=Petrotoga sibirica TaxID=156202 RepID=A0A4V3GR11_9BACT|nr:MULTISPECIES: nucleobase:cation symporter-2 family protein [Petrotoga]POZ88072.1 uracil-xanthine permease [Petrotoga sibirica DSM 13575]POZ90163.1 uracil-xanthine permease [Petrotoga sp. SL27]TDX17173.1 NCS2 family nucleobase:cation symporter-2/xanthine permease XanP [Petrotoga sibirica]